MHCTPQTDGGWIDRGRWRRGHRLALLGVMTLTQCSAMASANDTFPGKLRGWLSRRGVSYRRYAIALSRMRRRDKEGVKTLSRCLIAVAKRAGWYFQHPPTSPLMLMNSRAESLRTLNLGGSRSSDSTFAVTAIATHFRFTFPRQYSNTIFYWQTEKHFNRLFNMTSFATWRSFFSIFKWRYQKKISKYVNQT